MFRMTAITLSGILLLAGCNEQQADQLQQQTSNEALDYTPQLNDPTSDIDDPPHSDDDENATTGNSGDPSPDPPADHAAGNSGANSDAEVSEVQADADPQQAMVATTDLEPIGDSKVTGNVRFVQDGDRVRITGTVTGLSPGRHGFHVHEHGDLSDKKEGKSAGGHYNPTNMPHGRPSDKERHIGDLGNIEANQEGVAKIDLQDSIISLSGPHSIVDRSLVIHQGADKFTQPSGDAGSRVAFGLIKAQQDAAQP